MKSFMFFINLVIVIILLSSTTEAIKIRNVHITHLKVTNSITFAHKIYNLMFAETKSIDQCILPSWRSNSSLRVNMEFKEIEAFLFNLRIELEVYKPFMREKTNYECHYAGARKLDLLKVLANSKNKSHIEKANSSSKHKHDNHKKKKRLLVENERGKANMKEKEGEQTHNKGRCLCPFIKKLKLKT